MYFFYLVVIFFSLTACKLTTHKGLVESKADKANKSSQLHITKAWVRETFVKNLSRPSILQLISPVMISSNLLVQGNRVNGLGAYRLKNGEQKWFFPVKDGLAGPPVLKGEFLFFAGSDGFMYAIDKSKGKVLWKHYTQESRTSKPVIKKGKVYFASPKKLYCLKALTGDELWTYSVPTTKAGEFTIEGVAKPLLGRGLIYFKASDGSLSALDFKGRLKWKKDLSSPTSDTRFSSSSGDLVMGKVCLYSADLKSGLYCLNKKTGKTVWKNSIGSHGKVLLSGRHLFYSSPDGKVLALEQKSGKKLWTHKATSLTTSLALYKNVLVYGEYSGGLSFLSIKSGKKVAYFPTRKGISATPLVSAIDSTLYFVSNFGWLYKLNLWF